MFHIGIATQHPPLPNPSEMSEQGIAFIQACVTLDPTARPSAAELIGHPWLAHFTEGAVSPSVYIGNTKLMSRNSKLKKEVQAGVHRLWWILWRLSRDIMKSISRSIMRRRSMRGMRGRTRVWRGMRFH
jgi:serine/threonine protein kinase